MLQNVVHTTEGMQHTTESMRHMTEGMWRMRVHATYDRDAEYVAHDRVQTPCYGSGSRTPA